MSHRAAGPRGTRPGCFPAHRPWRRDGRSLWAVAAFANPTLTRSGNKRAACPMSTFPDQFQLNGRTALITGSGRGLGWEMAQGLAQAGARVLLHGRSAERLASRVAEMRGAGFAADAIVFDMADRKS